MHNLKLKKIFSIAFLTVSISSLHLSASNANPNSSTCKNIKSTVKKLDDKNLTNWRKYDSKRDGMSTLNFSNSDYKKTLTLLKTVYQSDINFLTKALDNASCYTSGELVDLNYTYDSTIEALSGLNKIISASSYSSTSKFNSMKETIWLWIAGEYMNYYTLDKRKY
jgi:hypothetical protein